MPSLSVLVDTFNDGTIGPEWGNSYGGTTETGGRARVPCTTGYAGCQTAYAWTLAGATLYVQVPTVPAASTATEAYCGVMIQSLTAGTRVGFIINTVTGLIRFKNETGYYDEFSVDITYSSTDHKWLRIREDGTNLYWDTSPDGATWTNRRTLTTPAWVLAETDALALDMSAHRDAGVSDYAEYDFVNTLSDGAVHAGAAALTGQSTLDGAVSVAAAASAALTADAALASAAALSVTATAALAAESVLAADASGVEIPEVAALSAGDWDLYIEQGATFVQTYTVTDDPAFTWTGWTARAQIRSQATEHADLLLDLTDYLTVGTPTPAAIRLAIPAAVTETLVRNGRWDLEVVQGATVVRLLHGKAIISPEVTRA